MEVIHMCTFQQCLAVFLTVITTTMSNPLPGEMAFRSHQQLCSNTEECCKFGIFSTEFEACCAKHGCRPVACNKPIPEITCEGCRKSSCVDKSGLTHDDGSSWFPDECHKCVCSTGTVTCEKLEVTCASRPFSHCTEVSGPCCPKWDCSVARRGCTNNDGSYQELYSSWQTGPCTIQVCTTAGVLNITKQCRPKPHHNCQEVNIREECCPNWKCGPDCGLMRCAGPPSGNCSPHRPPLACCDEWNCSGCIDERGINHEVGSQWTKDPCTTSLCTEAGIKDIQKRCVPLPPRPGCSPYIPRGECCPVWNCSGCAREAENLKGGSRWTNDPCTTLVCTEAGIVEKREYCVPLQSPPRSGCSPYTPSGECCPIWNCSVCVDERGLQHEVGSQWTKDPCTTSLCTEAGIKDIRKHCVPLPPRPGCSQYTPRGECCPIWNCSGCIDERGVHHEVGSQWTKDPCTTSLCTEAGIKDIRKHCVPLPPRPGCSQYTPRGECCPILNCSGCVDERGVNHEVGSQWTKDPCTTSLCTEAGIEDIRKRCVPLQPRPGCSQYTPRGECCPEWNCSGCIDERGVHHEVGSQWTKDPCTTSLCTEAGIEDIRKHCVPLPPRPGCSHYTPRGECCPILNCSGCVDERGVHHEVGSQWTKDPCTTSLCTEAGIKDIRKQCVVLPPRPGCSQYTPRGECCPVWNCSGCIDERGVHHEVGSQWTKDPCTTSLCTEAGIKDIQKHCVPLPPRPGCSQHTPRGECCPILNCSGCVDERDVHHEVGSQWTKDPCTTSLCTEAGIKDIRKHCVPLPPRPGCSQYTPRGECCPVLNCSGCVDERGVHHEVGSQWTKDPCTTLLCTEAGIKDIRKHCVPLPPRPGCSQYTPRGECCPILNCSGCIDERGVNHEVGSQWTKDPCTTSLCREVGIKDIRKHCVPLPPRPGCSQYTPRGECCPILNCSGCVDERGVHHEVGSQWTKDPCTTSLCTEAGIKDIRKQCFPLLPRPGCSQYTPRGECCPVWNCSGCFESQWTKDNCTTSLCKEAGIKDIRKLCVPLPPRPGCSQYTPRGECCPILNCSGCVDERGVHHEVGSQWTKDPCTTSLCTEAGIKDSRKHCVPLPPRPGCSQYTPRGECCPILNCSGCVDERGVNHEVGSQWTKDPCTTSLCTEAGIKDIQKLCVPLPPRSGCSQYTPRGECCPVWNCSGCVDERGINHEVGSHWTKDPCTTSLCTEAGIKDMQKHCVQLPPRPGCSTYTPRGECCPVWNCSGCVDERGVHHEVGSQWTKDPCTTSLCTEAGIKDTQKRCVPLPPRPGCSQFTPTGKCCPVWNCSGCVDERGVHEVGSQWTKDPCTTSLCTEAGIKDIQKHCVPLPPRPGCSQFTPRGVCCPVWNCSGCIDERDVHHEVGSQWTKDPCTTSLCTEAGIKDKRKYCALLPSRPGCSTYTPTGECCPVWNCSGCVDERGVHHEVGSQWTKDPCTTSLCTEAGIKDIRKHCVPLPPRPGCSQYTPRGECCPIWNCSGCVDERGVHHEVGSQWTKDPCTTSLCTEAGIKDIRKHCVPLPPRPGCSQYTPRGECCPVLNCSLCIDERGVNHEVGSQWTKDPCTTSLCTEDGIKDLQKHCVPLPPRPGCSQHTPRGECCPVWNCSGCVDGGVHHEVGSQWTKDPCTTSLCTEAGIKDIRKHCVPLPPRPGCSQYTPRGECCPLWNRSGCIDEQGVNHEVGSQWTKDPCTTSLCTEAGIKDIRKHCVPLPPRPGCSQYTPRGECCPISNCRCIDERGHQHEVGSQWTKDPCTTSLCTKAGVKDIRKYCVPLQPRPGCSPYTPRGECCPVWNCSHGGCIDSAGISHELSSRWNTNDPCTSLLCTTDGVKRIIKDCEPSPPPNPSCFLYTPAGECCTSWNCSSSPTKG